MNDRGDGKVSFGLPLTGFPLVSQAQDWEALSYADGEILVLPLGLIANLLVSFWCLT